MATSRLAKSSTDKILFGVCGGLAQYFQVETLLVRVAFVVLTLANGAGLVLYLVLAILMPKEGAVASKPHEVLSENIKTLPQETREAGRKVGEAFRSTDISEPLPPASPTGEPTAKGQGKRNTFGLLLILVGIALVLVNVGLLWWFPWQVFWPVILIAIGVAIILGRLGRNA